MNYALSIETSWS